MKQHKKFIDNGVTVCGTCGLRMTGYNEKLPCPPWEAKSEGGKTPTPGGLDRLGVVKELKEIARLLTMLNGSLKDITDPFEKGYTYQGRLLLQQLISRLEGQGMEQTAISESKERAELAQCKHCKGAMRTVCLECDDVYIG